MKKEMFKLNFLAFILSLFVLSCTNEDDYNLDFESKLNFKETYARTGLSLADNPLDQLINMPLHITTSSVDHNNIFISARQSSRVPCLYYEDDNSGRQKWYLIKEGNLYRVKAESGVKNGWLYLGLKAEETQGIWPRMQSNYIAPNMLWDIQYHSDIDRYTFLIGSKNKNDDSYLSIKSRTETGDLSLSKLNSSGFQYWKIEPIEDFELISIDYDFQASSNTFQKAPKIIFNESIVNNTKNVIDKEFTYQETKSQTSRFSKTKGFTVTLTNKVTSKVSIPLLADGGFESSLTTGKSWSYTTDETKSVSQTITRSHKWKIQPNSSIVFTAIAYQYEGKVKYIATLKGTKSRKIFYLKGIWEGINTESFEVQVRDATSGRLLNK